MSASKLILYLGLGVVLALSTLTGRANEQTVFVPNFLPAKQLKQLIEPLVGNQVKITAAGDRLVLSAADASLHKALSLLSELDRKPERIQVFIDLDHVPTTRVLDSENSIRRHSSQSHTEDLSVTGLANEPIFLGVSQEQFAAFTPWLAISPASRVEFVRIVVSPLSDYLHATLEIQYTNSFSRDSNLIKTQTTLQEGEWHLLTPDDSRPIMSTDVSTRISSIRNYSARSDTMQDGVALKVVLL